VEKGSDVDFAYGPLLEVIESEFTVQEGHSIASDVSNDSGLSSIDTTNAS